MTETEKLIKAVEHLINHYDYSRVYPTEPLDDSIEELRKILKELHNQRNVA